MIGSIAVRLDDATAGLTTPRRAPCFGGSVADSFRQAADLPDAAQLATKDDVALGKADIRADIAEVKADLGAEIAALKTEIATVNAKVGMLVWMIGILGGGALVLQVLTATLRVLRLG